MINKGGFFWLRGIYCTTTTVVPFFSLSRWSGWNFVLLHSCIPNQHTSHRTRHMMTCYRAYSAVQCHNRTQTSVHTICFGCHACYVHIDRTCCRVSPSMHCVCVLVGLLLYCGRGEREKNFRDLFLLFFAKKLPSTMVFSSSFYLFMRKRKESTLRGGS